DGSVKLIDFGIAKANGKLSRTQVGAIKGKYGYMSPEQVRGVALDRRSDLFSLGICLWETLTLRRLFAAENELLIMKRVKEAELASPRTFAPGIPPALERITMRALARDVSDRYPTAAAMAGELERFASEHRLAWTRQEVAAYMRRTYAEGSPQASGTSGAIAR